jgi:hypothetical protein
MKKRVARLFQNFSFERATLKKSLVKTNRVLKEALAVLCFLCLIPGAFGQGYDGAYTDPEKVAALYMRHFSNLGFSTANIIIHNGYWDLYDAVGTFHELDIAVLSKKDLRLLRNAIYARRGMVFKSEDLQRWFSRFPWYKPQFADVDDKLTWQDKVNIRMIQTYENAEPNRNVTAADLIGEWQGGFPSPAGDVNNVSIRADGTIEFGYNTMGPKAVRVTKGTYRIENGYLVVMIAEQTVALGGYFLEEGSTAGAIGNETQCTLIYTKPVRAVLPVGEMHETFQEWTAKNRAFGSSLKFKIN